MKCSEVEYDMQGEGFKDSWYEGIQIGSLIYNPKMGQGHVITRIEKCNCNVGAKAPIYNCGCDGYFNKECDVPVYVCECGEDNSWRDHHYFMLKR